MKSLIVIPASVALALSLAACERTSVPADGNSAATVDTAAADSDAVKQAFTAFNAAIAAKDMEGIKASYASDAVMVIPDQPPFNGIDAIMADYKTFAADPAAKFVPATESTEVSSGGDLAYGQVNYQVTFTNPKTKAVETADRYNLTVYKKQPDGSWKVVRDVNTTLPKAG